MTEVSVDTTKAFLYGASQCGVDVVAILQAVGVDSDSLKKPDTRISFDKQLELWNEAAKRSGDRDFGLHWAEAVPFEMYGIVSRMAAVSANIGQAIERYVRYYVIVHSMVEVRLERSENIARLSQGLRRAPWQMMRHLGEGALSVVWQGVQQIAGRPIRPIEVHFQHSQPTETGEHQRAFNAPVLFSQPRNEIILDAKILDYPIAEANPALLEEFDRQAQKMQARLPEADPFVQQVRQVIYESLSSGELGMKSIARKLGLTTAALRRRLSTQHTSYQPIVRSIRRELALVYMEDRQWSIAEIAYVLGFLDPASFKRSFKRWVGMTPGDYRRKIFG